MTPEGKVKQRISSLLKGYRDLYYDMPVPGGFGKSGLDYHCCYRGRYFAIEAKAPGNKPTPRQEQTIATLRRAGAAVFVVSDTTTLEELKSWLETQQVSTA